MTGEPMTKERWEYLLANYENFSLSGREADEMLGEAVCLAIRVNELKKALRWARKRLHDELDENGVMTEEDLLEELLPIDAALGLR